jgi:hypothetical protein
MLRINPILLLLIFASFPYGLPNHHFLVTFCFTCTSAGSRTHHFIHHQFAHLRTSLHFTYLIQKLANGAPTLHQFFMINLPSLGHAFFHTGAPVSVFVHFFPNYLLFIIYYLLYKHLFLQSVHSLSSPLATCFFWPYATHVTLGLEQYLSFTLADIIHIFRVPRRSVTSTL